MSSVREWLPAGHITSDNVRAAIADAVAAWSEAWFGRAAVRLSLVRLADTSTPRAHWSTIAGWRMSLPRAGGRKLAMLALDAGPDQQPATDADNELVEAFEASLLADLGERLTVIFEAGGQPPSEAVPQAGDLIATLWTDDAEIGQVAFAGDTVVAFVRRRAPPRRPPAEPLAGRRQAIGPNTVALEARIGTATLALSDVRSLSVDDVLVLDASVQDLVSLTLKPQGTVVARGRLTQIDDCMALVLER